MRMRSELHSITIMNRLFTFGCSFTQYWWPTWAEILGNQPYFTEHQNWGLSGFGNLGIACSVAEAHARHKFTSADTVIIMWSGIYREDRWVSQDWFRSGHINYSSDYPAEFIDKFIDYRGCAIRDFAQITTVQHMLTSTGCNYHFLSMHDLGEVPFDDMSPEDISDVIDLYSDTLNMIKPSVHEVIFDNCWHTPSRNWNNKPRSDYHPLPAEHTEYLQQVLPEYQLTSSSIQQAQQDSEFIIRNYGKLDIEGHFKMAPPRVHRF